MQALNINVSLIDKTALYPGKKGQYLALTLHENREGEDQYGNAGFITQDLGKDRRMAGEKGPILGNWKYLGQKPQAQPAPQPRDNGGKQFPDDGDDIPFAPLDSRLI